MTELSSSQKRVMLQSLLQAKIPQDRFPCNRQREHAYSIQRKYEAQFPAVKTEQIHRVPCYERYLRGVKLPASSEIPSLEVRRANPLKPKANPLKWEGPGVEGVERTAKYVWTCLQVSLQVTQHLCPVCLQGVKCILPILGGSDGSFNWVPMVCR